MMTIRVSAPDISIIYYALIFVVSYPGRLIMLVLLNSKFDYPLRHALGVIVCIIINFY